MRLRDRSGAPSVLARRWPLVVSVLVLGVATAGGVRAALAATGGQLTYTLDDAYTHLAMARTLVVDGLWGCTVHAFASASSSPLWVATLAIAFAATGGVRDSAPLVLNVLFAALTLVVADAWLRRQRATGVVRLVTLLGLLVVFPMPATALYGMEHMLHGLLTIAFGAAAAVSLSSAPAGAVRHDWRRLALLAMLLGASRYEGLFLVGLASLGFVLAGRWRDGVLLGGVGALPVVVLGLVSLANGSLFLPNSLALKAGGAAASPLAALFKPVGQADWLAFRQNPALLAITVAAVALGGVQAWRHRSARHATVVLCLFVALATVLHVHFAFSSEFWVYRYDAYLLAFAVFALGIVVADVGPALPGPAWFGSAAGVAAVVAAVLALGQVKSALVPAAEAALSSRTFREHVQLARFVERYYPGQTVVVNDIGVMAYRSGTRALDMFGLCNIEPVLARRRPSGYDRADVRAWAERERASIAILQMGWGWVPPHVPAEWRLVARMRLMPEDGLIGFFAIDPAVSAVDLRGDIGEFFGPMAAANGYELDLTPR